MCCFIINELKVIEILSIFNKKDFSHLSERWRPKKTPLYPDAYENLRFSSYKVAYVNSPIPLI